VGLSQKNVRLAKWQKYEVKRNVHGRKRKPTASVKKDKLLSKSMVHALLDRTCHCITLKTFSIWPYCYVHERRWWETHMRVLSVVLQVVQKGFCSKASIPSNFTSERRLKKGTEMDSMR
jgi:hypothetical protein